MQNKHQTAYLTIHPRKCVACWKCISICPKQVIGKVQFLWHKHIVIKNPTNCIDCGKCIKACSHDVISKR